MSHIVNLYAHFYQKITAHMHYKDRNRSCEIRSSNAKISYIS